MKLLQKGTQITWTVDKLLKEGFIKVGSKTYEEYWKHTKTDDVLTLSRYPLTACTARDVVHSIQACQQRPRTLVR